MKRLAKITSLIILVSVLLTVAVSAVPKKYDVNGDEWFDLRDVICLFKAVASQTYDEKTDLNGDGFVLLSDVMTSIRALLSGGGAVGEVYTYTDIVNRLVDTELLCDGGIGEESELFSSYSRTSKYTNGTYSGWRHNADGSGYIEKTEDGGQLLADITGAGYISRIWTATSGAGHVKIFIDGSKTPTVDLSFTDYFNCTAEPFVYKNLVYEDSARGKNNYVPITFAKSCKVVAYGGFGDDGWGKYFHINYTLFPDGTVVESMPKTLSAEQKAALSAVDTFIGESIGTNPEGYADAAFETFTVTKASPAVKTFNGKGAISGLLVRVDSLENEYPNSYRAVKALKDLRIRIYWDGMEKPFADSPLGDFFASSYGYNDVQTMFLGVRDDRTMYNYFYMPYLDGAKIEIYTVGDEAETVSLSVNVVENTADEENMLYYSTQFTLGHYHPDALINGVYDTAAKRSPDYHFLTVNGGGRLVGVNLHLNKTVDGVDPLSTPGDPWWGEGDEKFFVDGEKFPSWYGTGTEDFFGYAWCSPLLYTKAYHAQSYCEGSSNSIGNRVETRIMISDSLPFDTGFEGYIEKYYTDEYVKYGITSYLYRAKDSVLCDVDYDGMEKLDYYEPATSGNYLVEGEDFYIEEHDSASGMIDHQTMDSYSPAWSGGVQMYVGRMKDGESITFTLPAPRDGEYMLLVSMANAKDFGIVQFNVNGGDVGVPIDCYGEVVAADYLYEIGKVTLKEGYSNSLKAIITGKNSSSSAYNMGIDFVLMVPVNEYTSLGELDLTKYTDVPRLNTKREITDTTNAIYEGETDLHKYAFATAGSVTAQSMTGFGSSWSGGKQLWWQLGEADESMRAAIWVEEAGTYDITVDYISASDYGIFTMLLNGVKVGNVDGYSSGVKHNSINLGTLSLKAGFNKIGFTVSSKNASATKYFVGIDSIRISKASVCEGEDELYSNATVTTGKTTAQTITSVAFSGQEQLFWTANAVNSVLTTCITVEKTGKYNLSGAFCMAKDYGAFDIYVNGTKIGSFDGYDAALSRSIADFGRVSFNAGVNEIKLVITGKNVASSNYFVGIDYLKLTK